jgi:hypothetical protein
MPRDKAIVGAMAISLKSCGIAGCRGVSRVSGRSGVSPDTYPPFKARRLDAGIATSGSRRLAKIESAGRRWR